MNVFIEGPAWMGYWSEVTESALQNLGHTTGLHYHNSKPIKSRISRALVKLLPVLSRLGLTSDWSAISNRNLLRTMGHNKWDVLISIQGKIDRDTAEKIRQNNPGIKIAYWWGDALREKAIKRLDEVYPLVDALLFAFKGDCEDFIAKGRSKAMFFPVGVSKDYHTGFTITDKDRKKFTCDISFVGTCHPERCKTLQEISRKSNTPITVWGRGWHRCKGIHSKGRLKMQDTLKVHACSRIALNLHQEGTNNGFNIRFFEIPAANGFEICDWQPEMDNIPAGKFIASFRSIDELVEKIQYYLSHEDAREAMRKGAHDAVLQYELYEIRFAELLRKLR